MRWTKISWIGALVAAALCLSIGIGLIVFPGHPWQENLTTCGAAIGGLWALSAGLLTYSAAIWGVSRQESLRKQEVASVCLAEIEAVWAKLEDMNVIENLRTSTQNLRADALDGTSYRGGSIGDAWLSLQSSNPEAFGVLPHTLARRLSSHYSRLRIVIGRLNWMNQAHFNADRFDEVRGRQNTTEKELRDLEKDKIGLVPDLAILAVAAIKT